MKVKVVCSHCQTSLNAPASLAGTSTTCPKCGARVTVPIQQPFEYRMIQVPRTLFTKRSKGSEAATYLEITVNDEAKQGWEFYRIDQFSVEEPAGCLFALYGVKTVNRDFHVITFRRPFGRAE